MPTPEPSPHGVARTTLARARSPSWRPGLLATWSCCWSRPPSNGSSPRCIRNGARCSMSPSSAPAWRGLAAAFVLKRLGVRNMRVLDRSPEDFEGPWATYARMQTLRSPPELVGPALGLANLTFRAWFEAQFGREAWKAVHRIPRLQWMDYLRWYRRIIDVPIENEVEITSIAGDPEAVVLSMRSAAGERQGCRAPRGAGDGTRRPWRAVRAGPVPSARPSATGRTPATTSISPRYAARPSA